MPRIDLRPSDCEIYTMRDGTRWRYAITLNGAPFPLTGFTLEGWSHLPGSAVHSSDFTFDRTDDANGIGYAEIPYAQFAAMDSGAHKFVMKYTDPAAAGPVSFARGTLYVEVD